MNILPSGIRLVSGGTRVWPVMNRPWQPDYALLAGKDNCPLCMSPEKSHLTVKEYPNCGEGWFVRKNETTPFTSHHLVLPMSCKDWGETRWRRLGGTEEIKNALSIVADLATTAQGQELKVLAHVGFGGGQNWWHPHWHIISSKNPNGVEKTLQWIESNTLELAKFPMRVVLGGSRAGKCWFHSPANQNNTSFEQSIESITDTLDHLVHLLAEKFVSQQGVPPDFNVLLRIAASGQFQYGCLTPILNNWGANDVAGVDEGNEIVLPWPHEATLTFLVE